MSECGIQLFQAPHMSNLRPELVSVLESWVISPKGEVRELKMFRKVSFQLIQLGIKCRIEDSLNPKTNITFSISLHYVLDSFDKMKRLWETLFLIN